MTDPHENIYNRAPLPEGVDPFALADAESRLVKVAREAGRAPLEAAVFVRAMLRQVATAWGVPLPASEIPAGPFPRGVQVTEGLERRREWNARPLESYLKGDKVFWRDEDMRWLPGVVLEPFDVEQQIPHVTLTIEHSLGRRVHCFNDARIQPRRGHA